MSDTKKKYNETVAGAYKTKVGYWSLDIDAKTYDALQKIELGGRLVLNIRSEESKQKSKNPDTAFDAFFNYMTPDEVKEWKAKSKANSGQSTLSKKGRSAPSADSESDF